MQSILFLIPSLAARGAERALVNLVNSLDKSRYRITVQTLFDVGPLRQELSPEIEYRPGLPWLVRGNVAFLKLFSPSILYRTIIRKRYDIVIAYLEGTCTRILSGCPYPDVKKIAWHHTCFPTVADFAYCYRSLSEAQSCYQHFDRLVAVSDLVRQSIGQYVDLPCEVIHNIIEDGRIRQLALDPVSDIVFPDHPKLFTIGTLEPAKGYDRLLHVHCKLLKAGYIHSLYIIGEGSLRSSLQRQASQLGISDSVHFLGHQDNPYRYLAHADLYVCSSNREGLSTAVSEALILGKPVISTDCGGARELLGDHSEYGMVVDNSEQGLFDGLLRLLSDSELMKSCAEKSSAGARHLCKSVVLAQHERLFNMI